MALQVELRFVSKPEHKTLVTKVRTCADLAEALRWAAAVLDKSTPEDRARVTNLRIRVILPEEPAVSSTTPAFAVADLDG